MINARYATIRHYKNVIDMEDMRKIEQRIDCEIEKALSNNERSCTYIRQVNADFKSGCEYESNLFSYAQKIYRQAGYDVRLCKDMVDIDVQHMTPAASLPFNEHELAMEYTIIIKW